MKITNKFGLPTTFQNFLEADEYNSGGSFYTATYLIDSPRVRLLRRTYDDQIEVDIADEIWLLLGKAMHLMSQYGEDARNATEKRAFMKSRGVTISAQVDLVERHDDAQHFVSLIEHKCTSVWSTMLSPNGVKPEWEKQVNIQAEVIEQSTPLFVAGAKICVIHRDWIRSKAGQNGHPTEAVQMFPVKLWPKQERIDYIDQRVALHLDAELDYNIEGKLPDCTPEERWQKPDQYAVMKKGRKTASRVLDTEDEAKDWIKENGTGAFSDWSVMKRPGEYTRCAGDWCKCAKWCDQWKREQANEAGD